MLKRLETLPLAAIAGGALLAVILIRLTTPGSSSSAATVWAIFLSVALAVLVGAVIAAAIRGLARRRSH